MKISREIVGVSEFKSHFMKSLNPLLSLALFTNVCLIHTNYSWDIKWQKYVGIKKKISWKYEKKLWEPLGIRMLPALHSKSSPFNPNWAGLAVLFRRQLLNGSQDFCFNILIVIYFFKYEIIETLDRRPRIFAKYFSCRYCVLYTWENFHFCY